MSLASSAGRLAPQVLLRWSIAVAVLTISLKTLAWWLTDSVGLLSDAMESLVNLASAVFALLMVKIAQRPADAGHPYGHHKAEYFSAGFEGLMIMVAAAGILWAAVLRLLDPQPLAQLGIGLALSVLSSALNGALAWAMLQSSRQHRSMALEGDARHLFTDVWTSVGVVVGISLVALTDWLWLDPVLAIGVALNILREGVHLVWRSAQGLMDQSLEQDVIEDIQKTLLQFKHRTIRFDHVSTRRSGSRRFVDLHMHMPAHWTLGRAAAVRGAVEQALMSAVPGLRCTIQLLPMDVEAHSQDEEDLI
ncbi:cation diffusion facilitator family transporter [Ramlibacter alkalitolerans]|uniref:Cation transporter n=1 Tax=Ramlibacter alkalitolerans TaxID=2039631 RepID=A0ABS1JQI9_9BURK|nr:cation diffusion facilitator family transporter [Ramlibacter alkalitolerans]MBL0426416.1 cation transporter [Ramlibacter alkalitolerans]